MAEMVNHPQHYGGETVYEVIKVLEAWLTAEEYVGFLKGTIQCYLARSKHKGNEAQDIAKATWFQNKLNEFMQKKADGAENRIVQDLATVDVCNWRLDYSGTVYERAVQFFIRNNNRPSTNGEVRLAINTTRGSLGMVLYETHKEKFEQIKEAPRRSKWKLAAEVFDELTKKAAQNEQNRKDTDQKAC